MEHGRKIGCTCADCGASMALDVFIFGNHVCIARPDKHNERMDPTQPPPPAPTTKEQP